MKKIMVLIVALTLLAGCSSGTVSSSSNSNDTAENLQDVANSLKETQEDIKNTMSETFSEAFGDLLESSATQDDAEENGEETETQNSEEEIEYLTATVDEMYELLQDNALKAKRTYEDQYVEVTGILGTIDASGDYICLDEMNTSFSFYNVQCFIKNDELLDQVMEMSSGKRYTVRVRITLVGELLGYAGDLIEIMD